MHCIKSLHLCSSPCAFPVACLCTAFMYRSCLLAAWSITAQENQKGSVGNVPWLGLLDSGLFHLHKAVYSNTHCLYQAGSTCFVYRQKSTECVLLSISTALNGLRCCLQIYSIAALFGVRIFQSQHPSRFHEKYHLTRLIQTPEAGILTVHGDVLVLPFTDRCIYCLLE